MKAVSFCGGVCTRTRTREYSEEIPKPMIPVGSPPILWHIMDNYSRFKHRDFVLCLGYKANTVKKFFLNYPPEIYSDVIVSNGGAKVDGRVRGTLSSVNADMWINGGYFVFRRREIFDYVRDGAELVAEPFHRLIATDQLMAYKYEGFWRAMDTLRDRQVLEDMIEKGSMPWRTCGPRGGADGQEKQNALVTCHTDGPAVEKCNWPSRDCIRSQRRRLAWA